MSFRIVVSNIYKYPNQNNSFTKLIYRKFADEKSKKVELPIPLYGIEGRYANSLYKVCVKLGVLDQTFKDLIRIKKDLEGANALTVLTRDPLMTRAKKAELLKDAAKRAEMTETTARFLILVAENKRLTKLKRIIEKFHILVRATRKEVFAEIIVARELTDDQKKELEKALSKYLKPGENLKYEIKIEPAILGGMKVVIGDKYIDMSIASKIDYYKKLISAPVYR